MLDLHQYKDILGLALDHQLARLKGGFVLDDFDPAVDSDKMLRARVERLVKQKKVDKLEKMLQDFILKFQYNDPFNFASVLYQKTGYQIKPIHNQHLPFLPFQNLRMGMSGKADLSLTYIAIELPAGSGAIYCLRRTHPQLKAVWLNEGTIEVHIPEVREEVTRVNRVRTYDKTIHVLYKKTIVFYTT